MQDVEGETSEDFVDVMGAVTSEEKDEDMLEALGSIDLVDDLIDEDPL